MQRVTIRNGRNPFEYALVAVSLAAGILGLALPTPGPSTAVARAFGDGAPWFYLALLTSAAIVITGTLWPRPSIHRLTMGMQIERIGLIPLGGTSLAYAAATLVQNGRAALVAALLIGGIGIAALVRARIVTTDLRHLDRLLVLDPPREGQP